MTQQLNSLHIRRKLLIKHSKRLKPRQQIIRKFEIMAHLILIITQYIIYFKSRSRK